MKFLQSMWIYLLKLLVKVMEERSNVESLDLMKGLEARLTKTLTTQIETLLKPFQEREINRLKSELEKMYRLFSIADKSFFGSLIMRKAVKKLNKLDEKDTSEVS